MPLPLLGGHVDDERSGGTIPHPQQFQVGKFQQQAANQDGDGDVLVKPPSLGGLQVEAMADLVAEQASCSRAIDTWVGNARFQDVEMAEAASGDPNERKMAEAELETSASALRAARKDANTWSFEQEECSAFWSSLEQPLSSLKLALKAAPAASGEFCRDEKERRKEGDQAGRLPHHHRPRTRTECGGHRLFLVDRAGGGGTVYESHGERRAQCGFHPQRGGDVSAEEGQGLRVGATGERTEAEEAKKVPRTNGKFDESLPATAVAKGVAGWGVTDGKRRNNAAPASKREIIRNGCGVLDGGIGTE